MNRHTLSRNVSNETLVWYVDRLWEAARDLPVETLPLQPFVGCPERGITGDVGDADLSYPIILSAEGTVMDGFHRLHKAWMLGLQEIQAVRFPVTPEPDERHPR